MIIFRVKLTRSPNPRKKWRVVVRGPRTKTVDFGERGASDYTMHHDRERMNRYVRRHSKVGRSDRSRHETWSVSHGIYTPGFWSRWLLWSKPTMVGAKRHVSGMVRKAGHKLVWLSG